MTEQEFRSALHRCADNPGLSSDRQLNVLAGMKGEERKVRTWNKMKVSLVLVMVAMMTVGAAVAAEFVKYVNWEGEPVDYTPPEYGEAYVREADPLRDPILEELIESKKVEEILNIWYEGKPVFGEIGTGLSCTADTLEEVVQLTGEDTVLPMPVSIPEGFELWLSYCFFSTRPGTEYRLAAQEKYDHGIRADRYACDREQVFMNCYILYYENAQGEMLNISVRVVENPEEVLQANAVTVRPVQVDGMDQAIYFEKEKYNELWAYSRLEEPVAYQVLAIGPSKIEVLDANREAAYLDIQMNSSVFTLDEMLAVLGLTAQ